MRACVEKLNIMTITVDILQLGWTIFALKVPFINISKIIFLSNRTVALFIQIYKIKLMKC